MIAATKDENNELVDLFVSIRLQPIHQRFKILLKSQDAVASNFHKSTEVFSCPKRYQNQQIFRTGLRDSRN